jgi:hypothetical protein
MPINFLKNPFRSRPNPIVQPRNDSGFRALLARWQCFPLHRPGRPTARTESPLPLGLHPQSMAEAPLHSGPSIPPLPLMQTENDLPHENCQQQSLGGPAFVEGFANWMGYAPATGPERYAMKQQTLQHQKLVGPNTEDHVAPIHIHTHESGTENLVMPPRCGDGPTESGQVFLYPLLGGDHLDSMFNHPDLGPGRNDGNPSGVSLHFEDPRTAVVSHVHPHDGDEYVNHIPSPLDFGSAKRNGILGASTQTAPGTRPATSIINIPAESHLTQTGERLHDKPQYIRIGYDAVGDKDVYWTLTDNPRPGFTPPASPTTFNSPLPGVTDYPAGPPGPYPKTHPAGPDHVSNRPDVV